jgi:hypothetical protein
MRSLRIISGILVGLFFGLGLIGSFNEAPILSSVMALFGAWLCFLIWPRAPAAPVERKPISLLPSQLGTDLASIPAYDKQTTVRHITGNGNFDVACVGESYRMGSLIKLMGTPQPGFAEKECQALLLPEDDNKHDANAVLVMIEGMHVAYLGRDTAEEYRTIFGSVTISCDALIKGSWKDKPMFGVFLDVPELS